MVIPRPISFHGSFVTDKARMPCNARVGCNAHVGRTLLSDAFDLASVLDLLLTLLLLLISKVPPYAQPSPGPKIRIPSDAPPLPESRTSPIPHLLQSQSNCLLSGSPRRHPHPLPA